MYLLIKHLQSHFFKHFKTLIDFYKQKFNLKTLNKCLTKTKAKIK